MFAPSVLAPGRAASVVFAILSCLTAAAAEPAESHPYCVTSGGLSGVVFDGFPSVIRVPETFVRAEASSDQVWLMDEVLADNSVLIFGKRGGNPDTPVNDATVLNFLRGDGEPIYSCAVSVLPFDPALHDFAALASGDCDREIISGPSELAVGQSQTIRLPDAMSENASTPVRVLNTMAVSDREIELMGQGSGIGVYIWFFDAPGGHRVANLCPVEVKPARG